MEWGGRDGPLINLSKKWVGRTGFLAKRRHSLTISWGGKGKRHGESIKRGGRGKVSLVGKRSEEETAGEDLAGGRKGGAGKQVRL